MLARLILFLLLIVAGMPAMADGQGCHEPVMTAMRPMPDMPAHHDHAPPAEHRCIGCMPLPDAPRAHVDRIAPRACLPRPASARFNLRGAAPPALPPPRMG